jgi:hypothetical protein
MLYSDPFRHVPCMSQVSRQTAIFVTIVLATYKQNSGQWFYILAEPTTSPSQTALRFSLNVGVLNKTSLKAPTCIFQTTSRNAAYSSTILSVTCPTRTPTVRSSSKYNLSRTTFARRSRLYARRKFSCSCSAAG